MISGKWFVDLLPVAAMALWPNGSLAAQQGASISTVSDLQTRFEQAYTSEEQAIFYPVGDTNTVFHVTFGATSFSTNLFQDWISNGWPVISLASGITGYPVFFQEQIVSNDRIRFLTGLNDFPLPCWTNNWDVNSWIQSAYGEVPYWENAETWRALRDPSRLHYSMTLVPVDMYEAWQELITQTSAAYVVNNEVPADCTNSLYIVSCPGQTPPFRLYMPPGSTNADLFSTMELVPTDWSLKNTLYNPGPYSQLFINESLAHEYLQAAGRCGY